MHSFIELSESNGPGRRCVLWLQGCTLGCPGCFNPETHGSSELKVKVREIADLILESALRLKLEGITISGGEPLEQSSGLAALLKILKEQSDLSVVVFTGYELSELIKQDNYQAVSKFVDVLIAGRFDLKKRLASGLIGSSNKQSHFLSTRYSQEDFKAIAAGEIIISESGEIVLTGIDPVRMR